jgi:hypothetical protein
MLSRAVQNPSARKCRPCDDGIPNGLSFTYDRDGSTVTARGLTAGYVISDSIGLATNWLMVGASRDRDGLHCQSIVMFCLEREIR